MELYGQIQRRLAAHRRQQRVRPLAADDRRQGFFGEGFDIGAVGEARIGHDGRRIAVHQHDLVALLAQGLACLRAGIVELARLPDHDRTRANQQNLRNVVPPGHFHSLLKRFTYWTTFRAVWLP